MIHSLFVSIWRFVSYEGVHFRGSGRQASEIEGDAPQQSSSICFSRRFQPLGFQARQREIVDGILQPGFIFDLWYCWTFGRIEGPVGLPFRALIDPLTKKFDLLGRQVSA